MKFAVADEIFYIKVECFRWTKRKTVKSLRIFDCFLLKKSRFFIHMHDDVAASQRNKKKMKAKEKLTKVKSDANDDLKRLKKMLEF